MDPVSREANRIFKDLFPGFRAAKLVIRETIEKGVFDIAIPFVYTEYDIPRQGVLMYSIHTGPIQKASFNPFASQPRPEVPNGIDYVKLLFVDFRSEFYQLEPILLTAFLVREDKPQDPTG
jgi:hypothetical protein